MLQILSELKFVKKTKPTTYYFSLYYKTKSFLRIFYFVLRFFYCLEIFFYFARYIEKTYKLYVTVSSFKLQQLTDETIFNFDKTLANFSKLFVFKQVLCYKFLFSNPGMRGFHKHLSSYWRCSLIAREEADVKWSEVCHWTKAFIY